MLIGNRLFPYPILNRNPELSGYISSSSFMLMFDTQENNDLIRTKKEIVLKNVHFELSNVELRTLFIGRFAACALIVECSASSYRKLFIVSDVPQDIKIVIGDLSGSVSMSAYLYAATSIPNYCNSEFLEDYSGYVFNIEKYDIMAIDDGYKFNIDTNPEADNRVPSIFTIVKQNDASKQMIYQSTQNKINICLSPEFYSDYDNMKSSSEFNNIMFAMLAIPALAGCLFEIKQNISDYGYIEEVYENQRWFKTVSMAYNRETNKELTLDELSEINPVLLAQIVLNDATCNGISDFSNFIIKGSQATKWGDDSDE